MLGSLLYAEIQLESAGIRCMSPLQSAEPCSETLCLHAGGQMRLLLFIETDYCIWSALSFLLSCYLVSFQYSIDPSNCSLNNTS